MEEEINNAPTPLLPVRVKQRAPRRRWSAVRVARAVCLAAAAVALCVLLWRIGSGVRQIAKGEITTAQMLSSLGAWLRGEQETPPSQDEVKGDTPVPQTPVLPDSQEDTEVSLYAFDSSAVPQGMRGIRPVDLWTPSYDTTGADAAAWSPAPRDTDESGPLVLVLHSHGGEGYTPEQISFLAADATVGRPQESKDSVVGVGAALVRALEQSGVPAYHLTTRFDEGGNAGAFARAAEALRACLAQYPTVRYVIDLHRDALLDNEGHILQAVTLCGEEVAAQIRLLASDEGHAPMLAATWAAALNESTSHMCYAVQTLPMDENWHFDHVSVVRVSVGTAGNTLRQAETSARALADALADCLQ